MSFISDNESSFSYLTREIFSYDDYLYNHSINVCTIGSAVLNRFNKHIISLKEKNSEGDIIKVVKGVEIAYNSLPVYSEKDIVDISTGYFLHDIGKVLIPDNILNKNGRLTDEEFDIVRKHSYEKGPEILDKNQTNNQFILDCVKYHHSPIYIDEGRCYPSDKKPFEIPVYVKICKLADIYDAMTSKRCYKDAFNPRGVVTDMFKQYTDKDDMLQVILFAFVGSIGIYPPGSVVYLVNNQLAYVLDSNGPIIIPFTDTNGGTLSTKAEAVDFSENGNNVDNLVIDDNKPLISPIDAYNILPSYLKDEING